jgi:hypothetical protein
LEKKQWKADQDSLAKDIVLLADAVKRGEQVDASDVLKKAMKLGTMPESVVESLLTKLKARNIPASTRFMIGTDGSISMPEIIKILRYKKQEEL